MAASTELVVAAGFAGKLVAGRYKLESLIGAGAVGEVWLAEHVHMRKRYALKLVDKRYATPEIVARFEREAQAAANVSHQGIAHATDFGQDEDGSFFLVLEYVQGRSLRGLVKDGPVPPMRALEITRQILSALGAAHKKSVIHRDLKPENVMIVEGREGGHDVVKILDFGIAKVDAPGEQLTRAGTVYGTPAYMAPEQALGREVDARADLWAVGAVLYELLTGVPPFPGEGLEILAHVVNTEVVPASKKVAGIPPELDSLVLRLLEKERENRPADVTETLALLADAQRGLDEQTAKPVALPTQRNIALPPVVRSKRTLFVAGGVLALLIVVPLVVLLGRSKPQEEDDSEGKPKKHAAVTQTADPTVSASASASASVSASVSASASASAAVSAAPPPTVKPVVKKSTKKEEKGFGKLKSMFK